MYIFSCENNTLLRELFLTKLDKRFEFDKISVCLHPFQFLAFSFYVQHFKTTFFIFFFSKYKYILAHFQLKVLSKNLDKLFPNEH